MNHEPQRRRRYASIVYEVLTYLALIVVALDQARVFDFSPDADRFMRGVASVVGVLFVSDKLDVMRDQQRARRRKR